MTSTATTGLRPRTANRRHTAARFAAAILSGILLAGAYALNPLWPAAWLAPIPLLIAASTARWRMALGLGGVAGAIGSLSLLAYMVELSGPVDAVLISLARALQWVVIAAIARAAMRLPSALAVFVIPAVFAGIEVLIAAVSPHGSAGSMVYSQLDVLPVIQVASVGGVAAIAFLLGLFASIVTFAVVGRLSNWRSLVAPVRVLALALGYGVWRLAEPQAATGPRIALIAADEHSGVSDDWRTVWAVHAEAVQAAAADDGAEIAVLPEKLFRVDEGDVQEFLDAAATVAADAEIAIVVGIDERGTVAHNRAYLIAPDGEVVSYDKRHLIPGFESSFTAGDGDVVAAVAGAQVGLLICKDLDFPSTIRSAASGTSLLVVPAWDFGVDAWFHSRLAILRGVENGVPVARSAREGLLTLSDPYGRVVLETVSNADIQIDVADAPSAASAPTAYSSIGDVFGWASLVFAGGALMLALRPTRPSRR